MPPSAHERWDARTVRVEQEMADERRRGREIDESFDPWHKNPYRIARLYRWLVLMGEAPANVADFIENCECCQCQYDEMCLFEERAS